jgi:hypothetical protein
LVVGAPGHFEAGFLAHLRGLRRRRVERSDRRATVFELAGGLHRAVGPGRPASGATTRRGPHHLAGARFARVNNVQPDGTPGS